jgi:uncharacterized RDD family membrane protein YckC
VGGWLIDWVITSVIGAIVLVPLHAVHQTTTTTGSGAPSTSLGFTVSSQGVLLSVLVVLIYTTACIGSRRGQTLGMMAVRAKAVDASGGGPVGYARALGRGLVQYVFALLIVPWIIDMLFPLWDQRRQTLHDKIANTVVIKT